MENKDYKDIMSELQGDYLSGLPEKVRIISESFAGKDIAKVELEFHKLKGTGKTYGVPEISIVCQEMEKICRDQPLALLQVLKPSMDLLTHIGQAYIEGSGLVDLSQDPRYQKILQIQQ